ncbi:tRNA nucleotidyltransferase (CCA-adding enzyme) [Marinococcus luteus]|uniref:tRNA nucleotidyltransferase (CCA-adding enzyme) n=1 Tax=Marinococcus luteus TaxID=1122204 RepID=A0A1H2RBS0_9BACI|nr:hypothetical protein [Marinococcus luteus]SDW16600.1 tRNA nucleotidyltransferase (CCA-adding enzyme) [Marinococcus luteus]
MNGQQTWEEALLVIKTLRKTGITAYIVGGAVRDRLMNRAPSDMDIAAAATTEELSVVFPNAVKPSEKFGTLLVKSGNSIVEVTPFREGAKTIEEDLKQRDFTCNAMAADARGAVIDPFNGQKDIRKKVLRTPESAERAFFLDPLRVIRAFRFSAVLGFSLDPEAERAAEAAAAGLSHTAVERIRDEITKLLEGKKRLSALENMRELRLFSYFPEAVRTGSPFFHHPTLVQFPAGAKVSWAALLYALYGRKSLDMLNGWRFSNQARKQCRWLLERVDVSASPDTWRQWLYYFGPKQVSDLEKLKQWKYFTYRGRTCAEWKKTWEALPIHSRQELALPPKSIASMPAYEGTAKIGQVIAFLEQAVVNEKVENSEHKLLAYLEEMYDE